MSIKTQEELEGIKAISKAVAVTLKQMLNYAKEGISTYELDQYGKSILDQFGAVSAPKITYGFPGYTCLSLGKEFCHGIPSKSRIIRDGDLLNIDVSAELNGYFADNGASIVVGNKTNQHSALVEASKEILEQSIHAIKPGMRIAEFGGIIEKLAKKKRLKVVKNLCGHGVGRSLHEQPNEIPNFKDSFNPFRFKKNTVVAIETFISTDSTLAITQDDGWTMLGNRGGYMAQHEHTIMITDSKPLILTKDNGIF